MLLQFADLGEVSYLLSQINASYAQLGEGASNGDYYSSWQAPWWRQADSNVQFASDPESGLDALSTAQTYFKAANYYFTGKFFGLQQRMHNSCNEHQSL